MDNKDKFVTLLVVSITLICFLFVIWFLLTSYNYLHMDDINNKYLERCELLKSLGIVSSYELVETHKYFFEEYSEYRCYVYSDNGVKIDHSELELANVIDLAKR